jgi:sulfur carrier protein
VKGVFVNGGRHETGAASVAELVTELGFVKGAVLVEHNGTALRPEEWAGRALAEGDRVELMRLVAGG